MVKKVLLALGAVVGVLVIAVGIMASIAPSKLEVERSIVINRPKDEVFARLLDLRSHGEWSPWDKRDPDVKKSFRGDDGQVGFIAAWCGNDDIGEGEQEITKIIPGELIETDLRFKRPMEDRALAYYTTTEAGENQTKVSWGLRGDNPFPGNVICMVMNMKAKLEGDFDEGLTSMKRVLEK
jgi:hypothetical protein